MPSRTVHLFTLSGHRPLVTLFWDSTSWNVQALLRGVTRHYVLLIPARLQKHVSSTVNTMLILHLLNTLLHFWGTRWTQLVEALRYKPEGRGFESR